MVHGRVHEVEDVCDDLGGRVVGDDVPIVVTKTIAWRGRRHAAVIRLWYGFQPSTIVAGQSFSGSDVMPPVGMLLVLPKVAAIVGAEPVAVLVAEVIIVSALSAIVLSAGVLVIPIIPVLITTVVVVSALAVVVVLSLIPIVVVPVLRTGPADEHECRAGEHRDGAIPMKFHKRVSY